MSLRTVARVVAVAAGTSLLVPLVPAAAAVDPAAVVGAVAVVSAPSAPRDPHSAAGPERVTVTWTAPADDGGASVVAYAVRIAPVGRTVTVAAPATSATVTGLADGVEVVASVSAVNRVGSGPAAATAAVTPTPAIRTVLTAGTREDYVDLAVAPDGTTFVATRDSILQVSPDGSVVVPLDLGTVQPVVLALGPNGDLYWADRGQHRGFTIRRLHDGQVDTIAGDPYAEGPPAPGPVPALSASITAPMDLAVSPVDGAVFIVDFLCSVVERFTINGDLEVVAGVPEGCSGDGSFGGDGGPATAAHLAKPQAVAVDDAGAVYVGDWRNHRIRKFTVGGTIETVAGDGTESIDLAHDVPATATGVPSPTNIAWAPGRGLLIDSLGRERLLVGDRLIRLGDDAFDRELLESDRTVGDGGIAFNDTTRALDWTGPTLMVLVIVEPPDADWYGAMKWVGPWLPATEPADHPGFGSWADLVKLHHRALVDRPPTASELATWVAELEGGSSTPGALDDALRRSKENLDNVDPVVRLYRAFLGRAPDAGGLRYWIRQKRSVAPARTWSLGQVAAQFAASGEFVRKYGSLSNRSFVTRIYTDVLARPADPSGVDFWTRCLDARTKTRAQVMVGFSESAEYRRIQAETTDVTVAYNALLGRMPDLAETSDWVTRAKAGTTHIELLDELIRAAAHQA